jgi:hypothetical protein
MCPIPNGLRDTAIGMPICKFVDKKETLRTALLFIVQVTKFGTVYLVW